MYRNSIVSHIDKNFFLIYSNQNIAGYRACSALLAGISDYQYTLRAWRKDVYELFLESDFFQMDLLSFRFWRIIVDRLITYDNTVFKDLMQKIVLSQSGAINIFANREQVMILFHSVYLTTITLN